MDASNLSSSSRMKRLSTIATLLVSVFLVACVSKPKNLIYAGMTTTRLIEKYGEPVRKETAEDGSETWFYKAQKFENEASQENWSTDTASPHFSSGQGSPGSASTGSTFSVSRTTTNEELGISIRDGEVTRAAPDNMKIIVSP